MRLPGPPSRTRFFPLLGAATLAGAMACLGACGSDPEVVRPVELLDDPCTLLSDSVIAQLHLVPADGADESPGYCVMRGTIGGREIGVSVDLTSFPTQSQPEGERDMTPFEEAEDWVASECWDMERWDAQVEKTDSGCLSSLAACGDAYNGNSDLYTRAVDVLAPDLGGGVKVVLDYESPQQPTLCEAARRHVIEITKTYATAPASALTTE